MLRNIQAIILAGGLGTRLSEETNVRPKPMVEIGGKPILWHILKIYSSHGISDFIVCLGYKGYLVKEYFANYALHLSDVTIDMRCSAMEVHQRHVEPWRVTLIDTGEHTETGGRLRRVRDYIKGDAFCMTYGDGVADIDITALLAFHNQHQKLATVTGVQPPGRFGAMVLDGDRGLVRQFQEKPKGEGSWINGGFFVLSPRVFDYVDDDASVWEREPMERLAAAGEMAAFLHGGFWQPMDTLRDKRRLEELWNSGRAPWKVW